MTRPTTPAPRPRRRDPAVTYFDRMSWAVPHHSKSAVDRAGRAFLDPGSSPSERELARAVINNWRSSHSFPLNTLQVNLRNKVSRIEPEGLIAQRIKRLPSIQDKLIDQPRMLLSRMQDIGGCRGVVSDVAAVQAVIDAFEKGRHAHRLARHDDYISSPKTSGYRGQHLVYRYQSDRKTTYNGLCVEVQVRTRLQHAWATAVETVGTFTRQALKSSRGAEDWLRFFALTSSALALVEGTPPVPGTPESEQDLRTELSDLTHTLDVFNRLEAFTGTLRSIEEIPVGPTEKYFVLQLDVKPGQAALFVHGYRDLTTATADYDALERAAEQETSLDVVLVSVGALTSLRRAYPNYYLDTETFRREVTRFISA